MDSIGVGCAKAPGKGIAWVTIGLVELNITSLLLSVLLQ